MADHIEILIDDDDLNEVQILQEKYPDYITINVGDAGGRAFCRLNPDALPDIITKLQAMYDNYAIYKNEEITNG
jgi:hypothetical protein